jgi:hypothetical protein
MILETMPEVQRHTSDKKLRLIEELWDDLGISLDEDSFPVTPEQIDAANAALANRAGTSTWAALRAKLAGWRQ